MNQADLPATAPAILCAMPRTVYRSLGCRVYDRRRDAWTFAGPGPVIAHPPCRLWGRLSQFSRGTELELFRELLLGFWCVRQVERWGGVVEQPWDSRLFQACAVSQSALVDLDQYWFGHPAPKRTWLYFSPPRRLPPMPLRLSPPRGRTPAGRLQGGVETLSRQAREATPPAFAAWLIQAVASPSSP